MSSACSMLPNIVIKHNSMFLAKLGYVKLGNSRPKLRVGTKRFDTGVQLSCHLANAFVTMD